ncbi:Armadillo-type fold domain and Telomere length regulation protein, conserved domain-containing protein [Strongyloides ratti]|uniref:Armadillo-type fold domain and Telomere length regulation protein, conserved domain-containing protein n=1 Tax=Strongyloides ratti TaxID=34506 RepID=A0A090LBE3_STRRB|nr:Armadillo-type fold domain and Telomere length regulation protein, conserved domain-containing protein [Strongyloides ratti]CEF67091.1 Armadillo-type fold domain and Telomere length regulation protein, conserved domain-containing protein [Strongyloides ratti]
MESLLKETEEIKSRQKLIDILKRSQKILPDASPFSVTLFYTELIINSFVPSVRSFLTSNEIDNLLYPTFLLRPKEAIEVISLTLGNFTEETHNTYFKFENIAQILRLTIDSEKNLFNIFQGISNDSEVKLFIDILLNIRIKICNLRGIFKKHGIINELLNDLEICYGNVPFILLKTNMSHFILYFCYKISQFNENLCYNIVKKLFEHTEVNDIFKNYRVLHSKQYQYLFIVLLKSSFTVSELISIYKNKNIGIREAASSIVTELMMDISNSNGVKIFNKFVFVISECLSSQEYLDIVKSILEKFENQLDMPDFVSVAQLLNIAAALKIMIRKVNDSEKEDLKEHIQKFIMCSWNSMLSADESRKQITFHFIAWFIEEIKYHEDKYKNIKDWEDENLVKSWELLFLEKIFDNVDVNEQETSNTIENTTIEIKNFSIDDSSTCLDSDDDDLPSFLKTSNKKSYKKDLDSDDETEEIYKEFHYISDCINEISDTEDRLTFIGGVQCLDSLLKKKALGYKDFAPIILKMFLHIQNKFYFEDFEKYRESILVSVLTFNPHLIIPFIKSFVNEVTSSFERLLSLDVLNLTASKLKKVNPKVFHQKISEIISTLLCVFYGNSLIMNDLEGNQSIITKILLTIGDLVIIAENTPQIVSIVSKVFRILKIIRTYNKQTFNTPCISVYIAITKSCNSSVLKDSLEGELKEVLMWVTNMISNVNSLMNDEKFMSSEDKFTQRDYAYHLIKNIQSILNNK